MVEDNLEKEETENIRHEVSDQCKCIDCQRKKSPYVQILDVDSFVNNLNDWD